MKRKFSLLLVAVVIAIGLYGLMPAGSALAALCTSTKSGNWNDSSVWDCGLVPGSGDDVIILNTHLITLTQDESVNNITIHNAANQLNGAFTLQVSGTLDSDAPLTLNVISGSTLIRFVGATNRALFGANWRAVTTGLAFEVALDSAATGTISTAVKGKSITIVSGTFDTVNSNNDLRPDAGAPNTGSLTVNAGATLIVRSPLSRIGTVNTPFASFTNNGTFKTSSTSAQVWPDATPCTFASTSAVEYNYNALNITQTIQTPLGTSYGNLVLSGTGSKAAPATLQIRGNLIVNGVTFAAGTGTVNFIGADEQVIGGNRAVAFNLLNVANGASVVIPISTTATALTNNGTLTQTRIVTGSTDVAFLSLGGYGGVTLNANSLDLDSTTVAIKGNQPCNNSDELINRCFNILPANDTGRNATITFAFTDSELNGNVCASMNAYHWNGASWDGPLTVGSRDCASTPRSIQITNVAAFSPFGLKSGTSPTAITLTVLKADATRQSAAFIFGILIIVLAVCGVTLYRHRSRTA
jgi:hypothetical protein